MVRFMRVKIKVYDHRLQLSLLQYEPADALCARDLALLAKNGAAESSNSVYRRPSLPARHKGTVTAGVGTSPSSHRPHFSPYFTAVRDDGTMGTIFLLLLEKRERKKAQFLFFLTQRRARRKTTAAMLNSMARGAPDGTTDVSSNKAPGWGRVRVPSIGSRRRVSPRVAAAAGEESAREMRVEPPAATALTLPADLHSPGGITLPPLSAK